MEFKPASLAIIVILLGAVSFTAQAKIYKWTDENGKVHFTDNPPANSNAQEKEINVATIKFKTTKKPEPSDENGEQGQRSATGGGNSSQSGRCEKARKYAQDLSASALEKAFDTETTADQSKSLGKELADAQRMITQYCQQQ